MKSIFKKIADAKGVDFSETKSEVRAYTRTDPVHSYELIYTNQNHQVLMHGDCKIPYILNRKRLKAAEIYHDTYLWSFILTIPRKLPPIKISRAGWIGRKWMGKPLLQVQSHSTEIKAAVMNSDLLKNLYAGNHEIKDIDISGKTENRKFILRIDFNSLIEHERLALLAISIIDQLAIILLDNRSGLNLNI